MQYQQNCTYQVTLQPSSKMMYEGDWGCCPNKQFLKIEPKTKLKKWVNLYRFTLLANLSLHKYFLLFLKLFTKISEKIS